MMLPKIKYPTHEFVIPSTKKKQLFRPFLVKEEKILLMSKTTEDRSEIFRAIKQIINNCALTDSFEVDALTIFDLEYLFLKLRAVSINNVVKVSYRDNEDDQVYDFTIDLMEIEVKFPEKVQSTIKVNKDVVIKMKYPAASIFDDKQFFTKGNEAYFDLIVRCIDKVYDGEDVYDASNSTKEEVEEFLDHLNNAAFESIQEFMNNMPKVYHELNYINKMGNNRKIEMSSLEDFFTLG